MAHFHLQLKIPPELLDLSPSIVDYQQTISVLTAISQRLNSQTVDPDGRLLRRITSGHQALKEREIFTQSRIFTFQSLDLIRQLHSRRPFDLQTAFTGPGKTAQFGQLGIEFHHIIPQRLDFADGFVHVIAGDLPPSVIDPGSRSQ